MKFSREIHGRTLAAAIAMAAINLPISADACSPPPPPIEYDARLSLAVTPDQPGALVPGTTGRIDLTVDLLSSPSGAAIPLHIRTIGYLDASQLLPPGALQPIRLTAAPDNLCPFYEQLVTPTLGATYIYTLVGNATVQAPQLRCSLHFEVLPAASQLRSLKFNVFTGFDYNGCRPYRDLNPDDDTAAFAYGGAAAQAVSLGGPIGWLAMAALLTALAMGSVAKRRTTLRRIEH